MSRVLTYCGLVCRPKPLSQITDPTRRQVQATFALQQWSDVRNSPEVRDYFRNYLFNASSR